MKLAEKGFPYVMTLGLIFGSNMVISRFSIAQFTPVVFASLRFSLASLGYIVLYVLFKNRRFPRDLNLWKKASLFGIGATAIPMIAFLTSLKYLSSGILSLLQTISPVIIILMAHFFLEDERLTWLKAVGAVISFAGTALLVVSGETGLVELGKADWRGYLYMCIAIFSIALAVIFARKYLRDVDDFEVSSIQIFVSAAVCVPLALFTDGFDLGNVRPSGYAALVYISLVGTLFVFLLNFYVLKRFGAMVNAQVSYIIPLVAMMLGIIFLGEQLTWVMFASMVLLLTGLTLLNWQPGARAAR